MKILIGLTYYRPYTSGLTIYAERLANALVNRGHQVTVLTSQYDKDLGREEVMDGVRVVRAPVVLHVSKGVIMPTFGRLASRLVKENDVVHLHLPQFDGASLAISGRWHNKPTIITYHCDLVMPKTMSHWLANRVIHLMNHLAAIGAHRIVTYTRDYADHSPYLLSYRHKLEIINPPIVVEKQSAEAIERFRKDHNPTDRHPVIGLAARFATEKGIEVVLNAADTIIKDFPEAQFWFAGGYGNIIGEEHYFKRLLPKIERLQNGARWKFMGLLSPQLMAAFYHNLDMLTVPSLNSTESFGLVQIEAMMCGVPVISSDLPGVRQPTLRHGMGRLIPVGDSPALAQAVRDLAAEKKNGEEHRATLHKLYHPNTIARQYEELYTRIQHEIG